MQTNQSCQYANKCALKQTTQNYFFLVLSSDDPWMQIKLEYFRYGSKILVRRLKNISLLYIYDFSFILMLQNASQDFINSCYYFSPNLIFHSHISFPIYIKKNMLLTQAPDENIPNDPLLIFSLYAPSLSNWVR